MGRRPEGAHYPDMDAAINAIEERLMNSGLGAADSIRVVLSDGSTKQITNVAFRRLQADNDLDARIQANSAIAQNPGESVESWSARVNRANTRAQEDYDRRMRPIDADAQMLEQAMQNLRTLSTNTKAAEVISEQSTNGAKETNLFTEAQRTLLGFGLAQAMIDAGDYNAILAAINAAYAAIPPVGGWPVDENNTPEHRVLIRRAIVEARSNIQEAAAVVPPSSRDNYNNAIAQGLTQEELSTLNVAELARRSSRLPGAAMAEAQLAEAQTWARERFRYLQDAVREENTRIQTAEQTQDRAIRNVNTETEIAS